MKIPYITISQMKQVDRLMIRKFGISLEIMMENAGRNLANLAVNFSKGNNFVILAGKGNNGGGGLVAARHLINHGKNVNVILAESSNFGKIANMQYLVLMKIMKNIDVYNQKNKNKIRSILKKSDMVLDCLLGYSLKGSPKGNYQDLIRLANQSKKSIIALDTPSGLDLDTGFAYQPCIKAKATITLALPKKGFLNKEARKYFGRLYLADISVPKILYERIGIKTGNLFNTSPIIRII